MIGPRAVAMSWLRHSPEVMSIELATMPGAHTRATDRVTEDPHEPTVLEPGARTDVAGLPVGQICLCDNRVQLRDGRA